MTGDVEMPPFGVITEKRNNQHMSKDTKISWATHTFNPWWGCTRIGGSPACGPTEDFPDGAKCYAETWSERVGYSETGSQFPIWGATKQRRYFGDKHWGEPLKWNAAAEKAGVRARVFCMSMGDWAEGRPDQAEHLARLWNLILITPWLDWLMLTKRPQLISNLCPLRSQRVWQGTTTETQRWFDLRWEYLKRVDAEIYWLSIEPMFEAITLSKDFLSLGQRGWVICGGQSGIAVTTDRTARLTDAARRLRDQCLAAGVRFHMKQMTGTRKIDLEAIPDDLRIREYPQQ